MHPKEQEQSPVSQDSLKSTDYIHSLKTANHSLQSTKTAQSMDSLKTTLKADQAAQDEHRAATKSKSSTAHKPTSAQVSWCKSSVTINGKTHPLPTTKEYICRASARPPAFQSTVPHIPSSLDGIRNHKALNGSCSSECGNQTLPSKSDTALFLCGKASANQRLSCH